MAADVTSMQGMYRRCWAGVVHSRAATVTSRHERVSRSPESRRNVPRRRANEKASEMRESKKRPGRVSHGRGTFSPPKQISRRTERGPAFADAHAILTPTQHSEETPRKL